MVEEPSNYLSRNKLIHGLSSVMSCLDVADPGNSPKLPSCVQKSSFPERCKKRFASKVDKTAKMKTQFETFKQIFVEEGGYCVSGE